MKVSIFRGKMPTYLCLVSLFSAGYSLEFEAFAERGCDAAVAFFAIREPGAFLVKSRDAAVVGDQVARELVEKSAATISLLKFSSACRTFGVRR